MSRRSRYARVHASSRAARGTAARRGSPPSPPSPTRGGSATAPTPPPAHIENPPEQRLEANVEFADVAIDHMPAVETLAAHTNGHAPELAGAPASGPATAAPLNGHSNGATSTSGATGTPTATGTTTASGSSGCTAPQLRRFIKSRSYVPMHELRRRFGINGNEDDVTQVDMDGRSIFVGLPSREGRLLGELLRGGDVGFELSMDPYSPVVVGVYPMRPVPRP
jgi:hypothetical protein